MRILLVVYDNESYIHYFPLGIAYIGSVLRTEGIDIEIWNQDFHHYSDNSLTKYLDKNKFDVVGLSVIGGYYQYHKLLSLSRAINKSKNRPVYIIGGHGPSPDPEYFLKKTGADIIVIGEGEETIIDVVRAIANKNRYKGIKGIAYLGRINERRDLISDIDNIQYPAWDLFPMEYYRLLRKPHISTTDFVFPVLSGRGCIFKCNFCYRMDKGFRPRSVESIIDEIFILKKDYGITHITFGDELLMSSVERTENICDSFLKAKLNIKWDCNGRLNYAKPDLLGLMKSAGCIFINYGIEAIDNQVLKNMNKNLTVEQITKGIKATLNAGISPGFNIIWGNIGDTIDTLVKGMNFLLKYDDGAQLRTIRPVTPYPGSPLFDYAIEKGLLKDTEDFYENKHINSDLLSVNFTDLTDEGFHSVLCGVNQRLIENYYKSKLDLMKKETDNLYYNHNIMFRGYRQY